jgi:hypothetical protein
MKRCFLLAGVFAAFVHSAAAHHLDGFDARIRGEAHLPAEWFNCKSEKDCDLVSVPCQNDLVVNATHKDEAREALIRKYPFCLGMSLHDTKASCEKHECITEEAKPNDKIK